MAFTVTFYSTRPTPPIQELSNWLIGVGEPFEEEGPRTLVLRALPVRLVVHPDAPMQAQVDIAPSVPLMRLVDLLFDLSNLIGADVRLAGTGGVTRPDLWKRLADEQDRRRLTAALDRAKERGNHADVLKRLWPFVSALVPENDVRWSTEHHAIVKMEEVGVPGGLSIEEAQWHVENSIEGDLIALPVEGTLHILAWRWLSEAYPGLAEGLW